MIEKLWRVVVLTVLALWGFGFASSKTQTASQHSYREAKAIQDADRRATETQRLQILADSAAKFDERQRTYGNYDDYRYSWNRRYRSTSTRNNQNYQ